MKKHPKELFILALSELCERFAFWGVGNLLVLYLIQSHDYSTERAAHAYGLFAGFAAFLPLLGGFVADRWNYHQPLIIGALCNVLGCVLIALGNTLLLKIALTIIAFGYGLFTPSILTLLGYTYRNKPQLREAGFSIYYSSINIGVFLAMFSLGIIVQEFTWEAAFLFAGFIQLLGLIPILIYIKKHHPQYRDLHPKIAQIGVPYTPLTRKQKDRIYVILILTLVSMVFWIPYAQGFSSMSIFILRFVDRNFSGFEVPTPWILSSESFFLILLAPILAKLYHLLQKKKMDPSASTKTAYSLISMSLCYFIMTFASRKIPFGAEEAQISWFYPILAYFFMAIGEMFLAPIGLSLVSRVAPKKYTGLLVGSWYVCVGVSLYLGGTLAGLFDILSKQTFFFFFALLGLLPGAILLVFSKKLTEMSHLEEVS